LIAEALERIRIITGRLIIMLAVKYGRWRSPVNGEMAHSQHARAHTEPPKSPRERVPFEAK
jgi:hypothetical protein